MRYSVIAARDGDTYHDEVSADNQEEAETKAREQLAEAWHMQSELKQAREEGDESAFDAELDGFAVDPDERSTMTLNAAQLYRQLADGLSDMIEGGRLTVGDIPDDYQWLVNLLEKIVGEDPGDQTTIEVIRSMHEDVDEPMTEVIPAPIPPPVEDVEQAECLNCMWNGGVDELGEIKGFHERVQPGDKAVPAGECPECGCLAYLKEDDDFTDEQKADMKHNAQMLDGCETEDEVNAELRAQTQGDA